MYKYPLVLMAWTGFNMAATTSSCLHCGQKGRIPILGVQYFPEIWTMFIGYAYVPVPDTAAVNDF